MKPRVIATHANSVKNNRFLKHLTIHANYCSKLKVTCYAKNLSKATPMQNLNKNSKHSHKAYSYSKLWSNLERSLLSWLKCFRSTNSLWSSFNFINNITMVNLKLLPIFFQTLNHNLKGQFFSALFPCHITSSLAHWSMQLQLCYNYMLCTLLTVSLHSIWNA